MHHQYLVVRTHGSKSGRRVAAFSLGILLFSAWLSSTGRCRFLKVLSLAFNSRHLFVFLSFSNGIDILVAFIPLLKCGANSKHELKKKVLTRVCTKTKTLNSRLQEAVSLRFNYTLWRLLPTTLHKIYRHQHPRGLLPRLFLMPRPVQSLSSMLWKRSPIPRREGRISLSRKSFKAHKVSMLS